jgi:hypothetical protein
MLKGPGGGIITQYLLVAAEMARLENRPAKAMVLYDRAIQSARENGYIQNEALTGELVAPRNSRRNTPATPAHNAAISGIGAAMSILSIHVDTNVEC